MTGRCDICEKIFNSHDGGWICPTCSKVYCPECEVMPDGANEPLCPKCDKWKIEYPQDYQVGFFHGALESDWEVTVDVSAHNLQHLNPRMRHAARIHGYRKGCAFVGKRPRNIQYKPKDNPTA